MSELSPEAQRIVDSYREREGDRFADFLESFILNGPRVPYRCAHCGEPFEMSGSSEWGGANKRFCSRPCGVAFNVVKARVSSSMPEGSLRSYPAFNTYRRYSG